MALVIEGFYWKYKMMSNMLHFLETKLEVVKQFQRLNAKLFLSSL